MLQTRLVPIFVIICIICISEALTDRFLDSNACYVIRNLNASTTMSLARTGEKLTKKGEKLKLTLNNDDVTPSKSWRFVQTGVKTPTGRIEYRIQNCATDEFLTWDTRGLLHKKNINKKKQTNTMTGEGKVHKEKQEVIHGAKTAKHKKQQLPYRHIFTLDKAVKKRARFTDTWILIPHKNGYQIIDSRSGFYQLFTSEIKGKSDHAILIWTGSNRIWSKKSYDLKRLWTFEKFTNVN